MDESAESASYQDAKQKVKRIKAFYTQLGAFVVVNLLLVLINLTMSPDHLWFYWVTLFWGVFLVWSGFDVLSGQKILGKDWEERKIQEYMEKK